MAKNAKRTQSQKAAAAASKTTKIEPAPPTKIPQPFSKIPENLQDFVSDLPKGQIYLMHVDNHPASFKRQIFMVPVAMNVVIAAAVCYRLWTAVPLYANLIITILGYSSPLSVDPSAHDWTDLAKITLKRAVIFLVDYLLVMLIAPWPLQFFLGAPCNPMLWRWRIGGFKDKEVVVRHSRKWDEELEPNWIDEDEQTIKLKIMPAISTSALMKSGYLLIDADWDLEFNIMSKAQQLAEDEKSPLTFADFSKPSVLVYYFPMDQWIIWRAPSSSPTGLDEDDSYAMSGLSSDEPSAHRDQILKFQEILKGMGKEDLFFRWAELIQYQSSQPGGFTAERQEKAMQDTKKMFEAQNVDFDKFWADVGGMQGMGGAEKDEKLSVEEVD